MMKPMTACTLLLALSLGTGVPLATAAADTKQNQAGAPQSNRVTEGSRDPREVHDMPDTDAMDNQGTHSGSGSGATGSDETTNSKGEDSGSRSGGTDIGNGTGSAADGD